MFCSPRYNWGKCTEDMSVYYYVAFCLYSLLFITYSISLISSLRNKGRRFKLKFRMRLSILLYSLFGFIHCISNFSANSLMPSLFTEICLSLSFLFIMLTILHLIENWIGLFDIISGKLTSAKSQSIFGKNFKLKLIVSISVSAIISALIVDVLMVYVPEYEMIFLTLHLGIWGANTFILGVLTAVYGRRVTSYLNSHHLATKVSSFHTGYKKFRFLMYVYSIAGIVYGLLYVVAIVITIWYYSLISWYIIYSLFHFAMLVTGFGMILILKKRVLSNKSQSTPAVVTTEK